MTRTMFFLLIGLVVTSAGVAGCASDKEVDSLDTDSQDTDSQGTDGQDTDSDGADTDPAENMTVFELNESLGRGVNLGNWLEAPNQDWGVIVEEEDIIRIAERGFDTIRVPVRWETRTEAEAPYTIDEEFFALVDDLIVWALDEELNVVIDMHHHDALYENPVDQKERFLEGWEQISERYRDQPRTVLFEILNEPHANLDAELWNEFLSDALTVIRASNPDRGVVIGSAEWGGIGGMSRLVLPDDENIIFTFHYYEPYEFTHQGAEWSDPIPPTGVAWTGSYLEKLDLKNDAEFVKGWAAERNVPVWVGEFGAYSTADMDSRALWTEAVARFFEDAGFTWAYWEYKAGFGVWDPAAEQWNDFLTDALFSEDTAVLTMDPTDLGDSILINGDFADGTTGWELVFYNDAEASGDAVDGVYEITITTPGLEMNNIHLRQDLPPLTAGTSYSLLLDAWSDVNVAVAATVINNVDWAPTYTWVSQPITATPSTIISNFTATQDDADISLLIHVGEAAATVHIDNVLLVIND